MDTILLSDRGTVSITGPDAATLLQDLVTCDVPAVSERGIGYGALLTPQGKILFDFILHRTDDGFVADLPVDNVPDFLKRLKLYRLRAKMDLTDVSDQVRVVQIFPEDNSEPSSGRADPRHPDLGFRALVAAGEEPASSGDGSADTDRYHQRRIRLCVPEAPFDFSYGEVFPHDAALDGLDAIAFEKGCYVGQEVVSRMRHRGTARKRILFLEADADLPESGSTITAGGKSVGTLGSVSGHAGIAIARLDRVHAAMEGGEMVLCGDLPVSASIPAWAPYSWPSEPSDAAE